VAHKKKDTNVITFTGQKAAAMKRKQEVILGNLKQSL
jgi:hypothetical protein